MNPAATRPWSSVSAWVFAALACAFALHLLLQGLHPRTVATQADLPEAPRASVLRLASLGETPLASRLAMLYVQSFDAGGEDRVANRQLDYVRLIQWLSTSLELDPRSQYPLFSAARIYTETTDTARVQLMLEFLYTRFLEDPDRRWPWLAHAALVAKHRLNDLPRARRYAAAIDRLTRDPGVPLWAKQMEIFILEDMNELEAARILLGGLLETGRIEDPAERRFLEDRLRQLEQRQRERDAGTRARAEDKRRRSD